MCNRATVGDYGRFKPLKAPGPSVYPSKAGKRAREAYRAVYGYVGAMPPIALATMTGVVCLVSVGWCFFLGGAPERRSRVVSGFVSHA